jgi:hypothetical protein
MRTRMLFVCAMIIIPSWATAMDGNEMLSKCKAAWTEPVSSTSFQEYDGAYCMGYIDAVVDVEATWKDVEAPSSKAVHFCMPTGVTSDQSRKVVKKYLEQHPEKLHWKADRLITLALIEAFPCK